MRSTKDLEPEERSLLERFRLGVARTLPGRRFRLVLFGSLARGDGGEESDIDILVLVEEEELSAGQKRLIKDLAGQLSLESGQVICLLIADRTLLAERGDFSIFDNIRAEGIPL